MNAPLATNEKGGAAPRGAAPPAPVTGTSLVAQIATLRALGVPALREKYAEVFGEATRSNNREWLFRSVAWQIQALAEGGLSERAKRRAAELARESDVRPRREPVLAPLADATPKRPRAVGMKPARDPGAPQPGSALVREYHGRQIRVRVLDDGFEWEGRTFRSLTAVAEAVTGAHWSGTLFFGLKKPARQEAVR